MGTTGIYKIESISHPDRCYIGSAISIEHRQAVHISRLKNNIHHIKHTEETKSLMSKSQKGNHNALGKPHIVNEQTK